MPKSRTNEPLESEEQAALIQWAGLQQGKYPELKLLYHIPNGGSRHKAEAQRLKAEGVKAGVPDLCLPVARGQWHGLYIELKRRSSGKVSRSQSEWLEALIKQGYCAAVCHGWEEAARIIAGYLKTEEVKNELSGEEELFKSIYTT